MIERLTIITPSYEDTISLSRLMQDLNMLLESISQEVKVSLVYVNDSPWEYYTTESLVANLGSTLANSSFTEVVGLTLSRNFGHQKALMAGLSYAYQRYGSSSQYVLMDCDGEDRPSDILRLHESINHSSSHFSAVVAYRQKRHEDRLFKLGYISYKLLFQFLSGKKINFGNFMILQPRCALALIKSSVAQSHIATALIRSRFPYSSIPVSRGLRYSGCSKMGGKTKLVTLGIIAIGTFAEEVITRLLIANTFAVLTVFFVSFLLVINFFLAVFPPIPGWTSLILIFLLGVSLLLGLQLLNSIFSLSILRNREGTTGFALTEEYIASIDIQN